MKFIQAVYRREKIYYLSHKTQCGSVIKPFNKNMTSFALYKHSVKSMLNITVTLYAYVSEKLSIYNRVLLEGYVMKRIQNLFRSILNLLNLLNKIISCSPEAHIIYFYSTSSINSVLNIHSFDVLYLLPVLLLLYFFQFGLKSHQHSKGYMVTFQLYWWREISGAPPFSHERAPEQLDSFPHMKVSKVPAGFEPTAVRVKE